MHEISEAQPADDRPPRRPASAVPPMTQRDRQRAALRDLLALATESAAMEAEIEAKYKAAVDKGAKEFETTNWSVEQRSNGLVEERRIRSMTSDWRRFARGFASRNPPPFAKPKPRLAGGSVWTTSRSSRKSAPSTSRRCGSRTAFSKPPRAGSPPKPRRPRDEHAGHLNGLNEFSSRAFALMALYGQRPGAVDPIPGEPIASDARGGISSNAATPPGRPSTASIALAPRACSSAHGRT